MKRAKDDRGSDAHLAAIVESCDDAIISKTLDGVVTSWNRAAERLYGYSAAEIVGRSVSVLVPPDQPDEIPQILEQLRRGERIDHYETVRMRKDGTRIPICVTISPIWGPSGNVVGASVVAHDISECKRAEANQQLVVEALHLLNRPGDLTALVDELVRLIQRSTDFEAVGVRLRAGEDFPYFVATGFPEDFVCAEQYLCARDQAGELVRDSEGNPVLECMCGNILCGRTNPALPFFTQGGSFWTNSTTHLLATTTEADRLARTRNRCNAEGYESVALIPLRSGNQSVALMPLRSGDEIIGLLQLNDRRPGRFTPEFVRFLEGLADSIGIALKRGQATEQITEQIKAQLDELQRWHEVMLGCEDRVQELKREVNELCGRMGETARYPSQEADSAASEALGAKGVAIKSLERRSK